jgi:hypothetical protein
MAAATLVWAETEPPILVRSADELFVHLERLGIEQERGRVVTLQAYDSKVTLGIGPSGSFVQIAGGSGEPPHYVTLGNKDATGTVDFYLHGEHHTEIPRRFLVPLSVTQRVVREFLETGRRAGQLAWDEI